MVEQFQKGKWDKLSHHGVIYIISECSFLHHCPWEDWGKFVELIDPVERDVEMSLEYVTQQHIEESSQQQQEQQRHRLKTRWLFDNISSSSHHIEGASSSIQIDAELT